MPQTQATALYYAAPRRVDLRQVPVPDMTRTGHVTVKTLWSGISRGTERLVFEGRVPETERERMRAPFQDGTFPFPVKYGYSTVGRVIDGPPALRARLVFALHPHQTVFSIDAQAALPIPENVPARRAILAANMETALNAVWDARAGPADRIVIVGGGVLGLLVAVLCAALPGAAVTVVDTNPARADVALKLGARFVLPEKTPREADVVFHASAAEAGLATALEAAGIEASVVELSWYGNSPVSTPLGLSFHSRRLRLVASQVGMVAPSRRVRWPARRRLEAALALLADDRLDDLITDEVAFGDLPGALPHILGNGYAGLAAAVRYDDKEA